MPITYLQIINIIRARLGGYLTEAGIDTPVQWEACIARAVREAGGTTVNYDSVTNAEIAAVADPDLLLLLVEYCFVKNIIGNLPFVDTTTGPRKEALSQLSQYMFMLKENIEDQLKNLYGYGAATLEAAKIYDRFATHESG